MAGERAGHREAKQGEGRTAILGAGAHGSAHLIVRSGVFLPECCELRRGVLPADHHQGFAASPITQKTGLLAALPFVFGAVEMVLLGHHSDRTDGAKRPRRRSTFDGHSGDRIGRSRFQSRHSNGVALYFSVRRLCGTPNVSAATGKFLYGEHRPLPASLQLTPLGNLSGFAGPYAMGYLKDLTGSFPPRAFYCSRVARWWAPSLLSCCGSMLGASKCRVKSRWRTRQSDAVCCSAPNFCPAPERESLADSAMSIWNQRASVPVHRRAEGIYLPRIPGVMVG